MLEYRSRSSTLYYLLAIIIVTSTETNHPGSIIARLNFNSDERIKKGVNFKNVPFHGENRERERESLSFQISYLERTRSKPDGQGFLFVETRFKFHGFKVPLLEGICRIV